MAGTQDVLQVLNNLKEADNAVRNQAEGVLKHLRSQQPQQLFASLHQIITTPVADPTQVQNQVMGAIILKKFYLDKRKEEEGLWQLSIDEFRQLKDFILASIDFSHPMLFLKKKAEIVCSCSREIQNYPELISSLVVVLQSQDGTPEQLSVKKVYAMYIFELLAEYHLPQEQIVENSQQFIELFTGCLKDPSITVKVAALKAITSFLCSIDDESAVLKYQGMMDWILDVVIDVLRSDEDQGKSSLESLIELTQSHGEIWSQVIAKLIYVVSQIIQNNSFEESTRQSALEIISSLSEGIPQVLRKSQNDLKTHFFPALMHMLAQPLYQDSIEEWNEYVEEEVQARNDIASVAAEAVNRIASFLGEKTILATTTQIIKEAVSQAGSWQLRQAGYLFLGMIADTCSQTFLKNIEEIMKMSAGGLLDPHPRVRYEALTSMGFLLTELAPDAQKKYHDQLVGVLLKMMREETILKLRTQATSCMVNFVRGLIDEQAFQDESTDQQKEFAKILGPYSSALVETIKGLFELALSNNNAALQEEVLALLSCVANVLEDKFGDFYNLFMPGLKQILVTMPMETKQQQELRSHCINSIGFILTAMKDKPEVCKGDAIEVAQVLTTLLNSGKIEDADPQLLALQDTLSKIGSCIKLEFKAFLPHIMPALIKDMKRDIDFKLEDADLAGKTEGGNTAMNIKVKGMEGERQISLNTHALENKIHATEIVKNLASSLGTGFFEQIEPVAQVLISELLTYQYSREIRKKSAQLMVFLIHSCQDSNQMKALFNALYPTVKARLENRLSKLDFGELRFLLKEFKKCCEQFWSFGKQGEIFLPVDQANELAKLISEIAKEVRDDKVIRTEQFQKAKKKMDEEDIEYFHEDIRKVGKLENHVMEIAGVLATVYKEKVSPSFIQYLLPHFGATLQDMKNRGDQEVLTAICFFSDACEHCGADVFGLIYIKAVEKFLEAIQDYPNDEGIIQSAAYGIGAIAKRAGQGNLVGLPQILQTIHALLSQPDARTDDEKAERTDNVIGALGKIVLFHFDNSLINVKVLKEYLSLLPLYSDSEEAQSVHKLLFEQILAQSPVLHQAEIASDLKSCVQRIIRIAKDKEDLELLDDEGKEKAQQILALMQ